MRQRFAQWLFVLGSLAIVVWGAVSFVDPAPQCRGVLMAPGDTCHYSSLTEEETPRVQTYEQRVATAREQLPFVIGVGAAAAIFGGVLLARGRRAGQLG